MCYILVRKLKIAVSGDLSEQKPAIAKKNPQKSQKNHARLSINFLLDKTSVKNYIKRFNLPYFFEFILNFEPHNIVI